MFAQRSRMLGRPVRRFHCLSLLFLSSLGAANYFGYSEIKVKLDF